jgi:hypothetical protein
LMFCAQIVGKPVTAPLPAASPAVANPAVPSSERRPNRRDPVVAMACCLPLFARCPRSWTGSARMGNPTTRTLAPRTLARSVPAVLARKHHSSPTNDQIPSNRQNSCTQVRQLMATAGAAYGRLRPAGLPAAGLRTLAAWGQRGLEGAMPHGYFLPSWCGRSTLANSRTTRLSSANLRQLDAGCGLPTRTHHECDRMIRVVVVQFCSTSARFKWTTW